MKQILAIDYGARKIGIAVSDETGTIAGKLPQLFVKNDDEAVEGIVMILKNLPSVKEILLGLPLDKDMEPTAQSKKVQNFAEKLNKKIETKLNIVFTNETYSTEQAEKGKSKKFKKDKADSEAARIFLQEYLNHKNSSRKSKSN